MSWGSFGWRPYVSVAERRAKAARELSKLAKKTGRAASPVVLDGRKDCHHILGQGVVRQPRSLQRF